MGKTQLALKLLQRVRSKGSLHLWLSGGSGFDLRAGLLTYGRALFNVQGPTISSSGDSDRAADQALLNRLRLHLACHADWVAVIDDMQLTLSELDGLQLLPRVQHGCVIMTCWQPLEGATCNMPQLGNFGPDECRELVAGRLAQVSNEFKVFKASIMGSVDLRYLSFLVQLEQVKGLPLVVDSFACRLAMDAQAEVARSRKEGEQPQLTMLQLQQREAEFASRLRDVAKQWPGNPRHLGPLASLQLVLQRIDQAPDLEAGTRCTMHLILGACCLLAPANPLDLVKAVVLRQRQGEGEGRPSEELSDALEAGLRLLEGYGIMQVRGAGQVGLTDGEQQGGH